MPTLTTLIPNVDVLVALAQEELAGTLLQLAAEHRQNRLIHAQVILSQINGFVGGDDGYPQNRRREAEVAVAEAWNWLTVQGLLIQEPGANGSNGWMLLSRRAETLLSATAFKSYTSTVGFP